MCDDCRIGLRLPYLSWVGVVRICAEAPGTARLASYIHWQLPASPRSTDAIVELKQGAWRDWLNTLAQSRNPRARLAAADIRRAHKHAIREILAERAMSPGPDGDPRIPWHAPNETPIQGRLFYYRARRNYNAADAPALTTHRETPLQEGLVRKVTRSP